MSTADAENLGGWRVELDSEWDVLGPFPVHAREQHFLSPAYPLDLSHPIPSNTTESNQTYLSSLCPSAHVSWTRTTADPNGKILLSHPSLPWEQIRSTEGWAGFQHVNVLRSWLTVYPPSISQKRSPCDASNSESENYTDIEPFIRTNLTQGAFFTILPPLGSPEREVHVPEWNIGNVYALSRAPAQLVKLPVSPSRSGNGTRYEVVVCGAYEIRLFGDPGAYGSPYPILDITFSVELAFPVFLSSGSFGASSDNSEDTVIPPLFSPLQLAPAHSVAPHIVGGRPFGDAIGIGLTSIDFGEQGWWTVTDARLVCSQVAVSSLAVTLLEPIRIAPTQTRVVPLCIILSESDTIPESITQLVVELVCSAPVSASTVRSNQFILEAAVPLVHVPQWTQSSSNTILATYFFARSMPTAFTVIPPHLPFVEMHFPRGDGEIGWTCRGNEPVLALHGAGVDIVTHPFFADSLLRQKYAWVILPQGRTEWGLDWHGPSTDDAFSAVLALSRILSALGSPGWTSWSFDPNTRVVLMGHSNGGQGAWYIAERYPDRVCGVVPASGYIKSQAYVPWGMSRFAHFIDPFLRAVLETSLTPDDNDVFMSNLAGIPILALQGGADDNVPPWHTRELVGVLKTCVPDADVSYYEDLGRPHWYPEILKNSRVQAFLDRLYFSCSGSMVAERPGGFTLTVAVPHESGPKFGWQIRALIVPGLLARLEVKPGRTSGHISVRTTNVTVFSIDLKTWVDVHGCRSVCHSENSADEEMNEATRWSVIIILDIDGSDVTLEVGDHNTTTERTVWLAKDVSPSTSKERSSWKVLTDGQNLIPVQPRQRLQAILSTHGPLTLLVPSLRPSPELSAALRIAYTLRLFHALDAEIKTTEGLDSLSHVGQGNIIVIGCSEELLVTTWLTEVGSAWKFENKVWCFGGRRFSRPSSAILFLQPHPSYMRGITLFLQYTDLHGLEAAIRLFPSRTGILSPDWVVVDGRAGRIGAASVEGTGVYACNAGNGWLWNDRVSWVD